jgi:hypothetical protein
MQCNSYVFVPLIIINYLKKTTLYIQHQYLFAAAKPLPPLLKGQTRAKSIHPSTHPPIHPSTHPPIPPIIHAMLSGVLYVVLSCSLSV